MPKVTIKHRWTGAVLYEHETTDERQSSGLAMRDALEAACEARANLADANLDGASLARAYLARANLDGASLARANLARAYLARAYLARANLDGANLADAYLGDANLDGASLARANLDGAYLGDANLARASLAGAYLDGDTKLVGRRPVLQIGPIGSRSDTLRAFLTDKGVRIHTGCFRGTRTEFAAAVREKHGDSVHAKEYAAALALIDAHAELWTPKAEPAAALEAA